MGKNSTATHKAGSELIFAFWLVFDKRGGMRLTRNAPDTHRDERAMQLKCTLPASLFAAPLLSATLKVSDAATQPPAIDLKVAGDALKAATGVDFDLRLVAPSESAPA